MMSYKALDKGESMVNTPPCYSMYMALLVFEWLKGLGGIPAIQKINEDKAKMLYDCIDESKLFSNPVAIKDRSVMNVPFVTGSEELDNKFVKEAEKAGFVNIKGHRIVGGMRASIYNAMPVEGIKALVDFMKKFEADNK
jgi:phosphoserine aminotransferase